VRTPISSPCAPIINAVANEASGCVGQRGMCPARRKVPAPVSRDKAVVVGAVGRRLTISDVCPFRLHPTLRPTGMGTGTKIVRPHFALRERESGEFRVSADEYRRHASECLKLMSTILDAAQRSLLLNMAAAWTDLAQRAEMKLPIPHEPKPSSSLVLQQKQPQRKADEDAG
jgi:hypothetical protein